MRRINSINGVAMDGRNIGAQTVKRWFMQPKAKAGASIVNPQGGRASEARPKTKAVKAPSPSKAEKSSHQARG